MPPAVQSVAAKGVRCVLTDRCLFCIIPFMLHACGSKRFLPSVSLPTPSQSFLWHLQRACSSSAAVLGALKFDHTGRYVCSTAVQYLATIPTVCCGTPGAKAVATTADDAACLQLILSSEDLGRGAEPAAANLIDYVSLLPILRHLRKSQLAAQAGAEQVTGRPRRLAPERLGL